MSMTNVGNEEARAVLHIDCVERTFPPYDAFHGTPSPMFWRRITLSTSQGDATFEQSDYGHPGRLNPWEPRGIATPLLPKVARLHDAVDAIAALL
jgi:hypothetical protein